MKKTIAVTLMMLSGCAFAAGGEQTVSIGYVQMKSDGLSRLSKDSEVALIDYAGPTAELNSDGYHDPQGMFIRYRYEFDSLWGIMGSAAYALQDGKASINSNSGTITSKTEGSYVSALAGPSLRLNEYISLYGLAGIAYRHLSQDLTAQSGAGMGRSSVSYSKTNLAYSFGAQFNAYKGLVIDAAYEGSSGNSDWKTTGFTVGIGYKF